MRITRSIAFFALLAVALLLGGCAEAKAPKPVGGEATSTATATVEPAEIKLGNLPTEDVLPLWLASDKAMFWKARIKVSIVTFQSAQERDAAFTAGAIDGFMGDLVASGELQQAGFPNRTVSICLGSTPKEGRFGIVSSPDSSIRSMDDLKNVPIGTSSGTIQEYMIDGLMKDAGVPADQVRKEEVKKVPVRFQLLMGNDLKAAALPEPFLSLAVKQGAHLIADDTKGRNLTQTVLVFSDKYLQTPEGAEAVRRLLGVWDGAAQQIDKDPNAYRGLLVKSARLPKALEGSYQVNTYPRHQLPAQEDVDGVLAWMKEKKLLTSEVTYGDITYEQGASK